MALPSPLPSKGEEALFVAVWSLLAAGASAPLGVFLYLKEYWALAALCVLNLVNYLIFCVACSTTMSNDIGPGVFWGTLIVTIVLAKCLKDARPGR